MTEALQSRKERKAQFKQKGKDFLGMLDSLQELCRGDIATKLERTKIETLVTIHVHQVELYESIEKGALSGAVRDDTDF